MTTWIRRYFGKPQIHADDGMAMIMVIGIGSVVTILIVAAMAFAVGGMKASNADQNWNGAMAAAYAGVEEYQSRLANDPSYVRYGNPDATFRGPAGGPANQVTVPPQENPAFGLGEDGTWATVSGSGGKAEYRYEVDSSKYQLEGTIRLRSTGKVGNETRSIVANLKQKGFIDFLYFTDYEISDPEISGASASCAKHKWDGRSSSCTEIRFGGHDVINGPMHTNDTLLICNSRFKGPVFTGNGNLISGRNYVRPSGCSSEVFELADYPRTAAVIGMPATNSELKKETRSDLPDDVPRPGCLYTGPTKITFTSDGYMTVKSPFTKYTQLPSLSNPSECGTPGPSGLASSSGQEIKVPENNVIYVQNVPAKVSGAGAVQDPNFTAEGSEPADVVCKRYRSGWYWTEATNGVGYPRANEQQPKSTSYECRAGDVFIEGTLKGNLTVAAEKYVYVTDNIVYADAERDMLGLIGNDAVWVWNPMNSSSNPLLSTQRRIDAAILSVAHTFQVQNYDLGPTSGRGTLTVNGAIAQKFRGPVGLSNGKGYDKTYNYDPRFKYMAPPKFLSPVTTTYGVNVWVEVSPVMDSSGEYREGYE